MDRATPAGGPSIRLHGYGGWHDTVLMERRSAKFNTSTDPAAASLLVWEPL
jgi:hypothetical protein